LKYSKATNYALHAMVHLIGSEQNKPVGVQPLAEQLGVSPTYLSKILTKLVKAGMIESATGANGGYRLSRNRADISFLDVIQAIEGRGSLFDCDLEHRDGCLIRQVMLDAEQGMEQKLEHKKLIDLLPSKDVVTE